MKILYTLLFLSMTLTALEDSALITKAVTRLIKENQAIHQEMRILKQESEKFKKLEFELNNLKKEIQNLRESKNIILTPFDPLVLTVKARALNIRSGPGAEYKSIGYLKKGFRVKVIKKSNSGWYQINHEDRLGWVSSDWLTKE